jgi:hypothetical protein
MGKPSPGIIRGQDHRRVRDFEAAMQVGLDLVFLRFRRSRRNPAGAVSCYMLTASEPFNDEMEVDFKKLSNWLDHYGLPQYHVHVSGHIMPLQLKTVLKEIDAAEIFPIRTENAELAGNFMRDLRGKVTLVEKGKEYRI